MIYTVNKTVWLLATLLILATIFSGCASHPAYVACWGKGSITTTINVMGAYGGMINTVLDCGEGMSYQHRKYAPKETPKGSQ